MMHARLSRRGLFGLAAGGAASLAGATLLGQRACQMNARHPHLAAARPSGVDYIDRDGWMLTESDGKRFGAPAASERP
jgi:hypothetical protein